MEQRRQLLEAVDRGDLTVTEACVLWKVSRQRSTCGGDAATSRVTPGWRTARTGHATRRVYPATAGEPDRGHAPGPSALGARRIRVELRRRGAGPLDGASGAGP